MNARLARTIAWPLVVIYIILVGTGLTLQGLVHTSYAQTGLPVLIILVSLVGVWMVTGTLIISRHPQHPVGWLLCAGLFCSALDMFSAGYAAYDTYVFSNSLPGVDLALIWLKLGYLGPYPLVAFTLIILLFPDGRLLSSGWRKVAWTTVGALLLFLPLQAVEPGPADPSFLPTRINPLGVSASFWTFLKPLMWTMFSILVLCYGAAFTSLIIRLRNSSGDVRQQIKWLIFPVGLFGISFLMFAIGVVVGTSELIQGAILALAQLAAAGIVIAIAFAIFKYRLYDVDIIINHTLVYGSLTAFVVVIYVLIVGSAGLVMQTNVNLAGFLITAFIVGAIYRPIRAFLQTIADRFAPAPQTINGEIVSVPESQVQQNQDLSNIELSPHPPLRVHRLFFVRVTWWIIALLAFGFITVGVHDRYAQLNTVSSSANTLVGQLLPGQAHALEQAGISVTFYAIYFSTLDTLVTLFFVSSGLLIVWFRPEDRAALLISLLLIGMGLTAIAVGMTHPRWYPAIIGVRAIWVASSMPALYLFPDGRFVPRWTRWLTAIWLIYAIAWHIFPAISPPFGFSQGFTGSQLPRNLWFLLWILSGLAAQIYRYRKVSNSVERQQIKLVEFGFWSFVILWVMGVGIITLTQLAPIGRASMIVKLVGTSITLLGTLFVPLSLGTSILRYHLFNIDIIINRTLVYSALTFIIITVYALVVGTAGTLLQAQDNLLITLLATGLIAVLFQPLRERLQHTVNRLIYGERDNPIEALSHLGRQMEVALPSDQVLPALVKTIAQTLKLPYVGMTQKGQPDISFGQETENPVSFPFTFQGETTGVLLASPRSPSESFSSAEMRLLQNLARQAGVVVRNAQLTTDLQRSRQTLVTAREEERHRLRRDLHDGIGPTMAGLTLKLDAARDMVSSNLESGKKEELEEAIQLLSELKTQTQETVQTIRHIVHTLRPPSLDVLGLVPALQAHFGQVMTPRNLDIQMTTTPQGFPRLSAAVEVAAYRIVLEAVTNVINHAQAEICKVSLRLENGDLKMEIKDDGIGLPKARKQGIGLDSMRERTEELGGRFELSSSPQGTRVCAAIPITPARNES